MPRSRDSTSTRPPLPLPAATAALALALVGCTAAPMRAGITEARGPVVIDEFVAFVRADQAPVRPLERIPGLEARVLSGDGFERYAALARVPAGHSSAGGERLQVSTELYVLEGTLRFGAEELGPRDFAFVPPDVPLPALASATGARMLVFYAPSTPDADALRRQQAQGAYVTRDRDARWSPGTVSQAAGVDVKLEIKHLKKDPHTGARTWLVRIPAGGVVPWERHSVAEEGYLLEGDYRLAECLPGGIVAGDYRPGGYFHRPGGVLHSGPESVTRTGATWLMRTPGALDVQFYTECRDGRGVGPLGTPPAAAPAAGTAGGPR